MMFTLKKSLGQHFLKDENICRKIVDALQQHSFHSLLEVGPGGGALTKYLIKIENIDFKAVELDREKVDFLIRTYPEIKNKIIHKNFLEIQKPFENRFTVVGNFPYNISSQILFKLVEWKEDVECIMGMFQKEMAQRVASKEGSKVYGVISVLVQAYYDVEYLFDVPAASFEPPPKVESAVIRLVQKKQKVIMRSERDLSILVKAAFNQRRKTLRNAVKNLFEAAILKDNLFSKRAEQLSVDQFGQLTFQMK
jgi:16S rRNA (adenine1518-N6/adenine1519-N6)-dimethyltransferase